MMKQTDKSLQLMERQIAIIMCVGLAMAIMLVGLLLFFLRPADTAPTSLVAIWTGMQQGAGVAWMMMGLFVLILTPVLRVVSTIVYFIHARDKLYMTITIMVFLILLVGMGYGASH